MSIKFDLFQTISANNKSAPSSHMFPNDPDDDDLFMTSTRSRTSSATFLSKLSSKVRHPTRTDLTTLQQVSLIWLSCFWWELLDIGVRADAFQGGSWKFYGGLYWNYLNLTYFLINLPEFSWFSLAFTRISMVFQKNLGREGRLCYLIKIKNTLFEKDWKQLKCRICPTAQRRK